jgi:two-component system chemotaxis response regulator CheB
MALHDIVVVGFSAGGIGPMLRFAGGLRADFPGAVFVVHHFPSQAVSALPAILRRTATIPVAQAVDGEPVVPGRIYVAPPDYHLVFETHTVRLTQGPREHGHRPAIDPLFRSAAQAFGPRVAGVILSGTLDDGTAGLLEITAHGGLALVQDPEEADYPGMARSALRTGQVDQVAPALELGILVDRLARDDSGTATAAPHPRQELRLDLADAATALRLERVIR